MLALPSALVYFGIYNSRDFTEILESFNAFFPNVY